LESVERITKTVNRRLEAHSQQEDLALERSA
jgi:hypothetical protein